MPLSSRVVAFMMAAVTLTAPLGAQRVTPRSIPPADWRDFTRLFDAQADSERIVGSAVRVLCDGRPLAHHEHGFADRARQAPVTERTLFHYASITKTMTAIGIMQLRERGRLSLDDPIVKYLPELRAVRDAYGAIDSVTLAMLLSHSSGFQNGTWPYGRGRAWEPFEPTTWNQLVAMMPYQELLFRPGSRYGYSNPGYIYLGRVIEQLSGDPWETYVQKNVLSPLGLAHSYFGVTPYHLAADRSHNYAIRRDSATGRDTVIDNGADFDPGITIPNGGWNGPLTDVERYLAFLTGAARGDTALERLHETVLPHRVLEEMWRPRFPTNSAGATRGSADESIGLSFFVLRRGESRFVGHTGGQAGFTSFVYLNPANGCAVAAAFNTLGAPQGRKAGTAFQVIREAALKLIE
jgi:CubicO group peptidase (beta-lactamase class C family)